MIVISPFKWQTTALTVVGPGLLQWLAGIPQYTIFFGMSQALQKIARLFCVNHLEVIVEEKRKRITTGTTSEERRKIWADITAQFRDGLEDWRDEGRKLLEADREEYFNQIQEGIKNAPPGSMADLLKLIAIVQDRAPEAEEALALLIKRYFRRRWVLFITSERLRLEEMWKLELSLDHDTNELSPLDYERDVAPLPLLETIEECGDYHLGELRHRMRNTMRNHLIRGGSQGRNIDTKEVEREYRLKELPDKKTIHWIPGTGKYKAFKPKDEIDKSSERGSSEDESLWDVEPWETSKSVDPWDPREVIGIEEEDKPLWDAICKAIPLLDDIDLIIVESIMYKIPLSKQSKKYGIPEGTLRSRKSRLGPKVLKIATKWLTSSDLYIGGSATKKGQAPTQKMDRSRPR
jgi:hypothetical protein